MNNSPKSGMLDEIMAFKTEDLEIIKEARSQETLEKVLNRIKPGQFEAAFSNSPGWPLLLEIKPSSPSAGVLAETIDLKPILELYKRYGVAVSVLTDTKYFGGSFDLLTSVTQLGTLPVLCKDFIFDTYQVAQARFAGATAVLLIVKALDDEQLKELTQKIRHWGMTPVIEIQDESELERALAVKPSVLLINNRDLQTLEIDMTNTSRLGPLVPEGILRISASGISSRADIEQLKPFCDGFLIGTLLMRQPSPEDLEKTLQELTQ